MSGHIDDVKPVAPADSADLRLGLTVILLGPSRDILVLKRVWWVNLSKIYKYRNRQILPEDSFPTVDHDDSPWQRVFARHAYATIVSQSEAALLLFHERKGREGVHSTLSKGLTKVMSVFRALVDRGSLAKLHSPTVHLLINFEGH